MPIVRVPDGRQVRFPDNMPREQIKAFIMEKFPQTKSAEPLSQEQLADVERKAAELRNNLGIDTSFNTVNNAFGKGFGEGYIGGIERLAAGATLGLSDWLGDKLGTGVKERRQELEELNPAIKGLNIGTDLAGGILTGGGLYKGVAKGLGAIPKVGKAAQYLAPTVTGAVSGGAYSGFENDSLDSAATGALMGGAIGAGSDLALRGLGKVWSAASKVKNTPRGFENAVGTKEGARTLNRAVRESDKIAEEVYAKAPETLETLNARAMDKLDDAVKGGVDVKGRMESAKKAYGDFIDTNKAKQQIFTPEQKALKGTVLIDKNGEYIPVYHGSPYKFDKFRQKNGDYNFSFSEDFARNYANNKSFEQGLDAETKIYKTFLKTKKPFDFSNEVDINELSKKLGNKKLTIGREVYNKKDFLDKLQGHYLKNAISREDFDLAKVGDKFDIDNFKLNGPMKYMPIMHKNKDYMIVAKPNDGFSYFRDEKALEKISKNSKNFNFKGDKKDIGNVRLTKVYNPDSATLMKDADNWLELEWANVGKERKPLIQFLKENGYDAVYKREDGQRNISVFNPRQIIMDTSKRDVNVSDLGIKGLTDNQKSWLNQAWTSGKRNTLEKAGSLGHLDEMSKELNKMVQASRLPNATGVGTVATPETVALQVLKDKVDDVIEKAGLQSIKAQYRQAKTLEDSFNRGLKFKPTEIKTRDLTFKTPEEKSAFAQGLIEQIKMNPETRNIAGKARDLRGALRKVLGDDAKSVFNEIDNINKSYKNVEKILGNAERKLSVPEPINGRIGLLRELIESPGSLVGGTADFARRWGTAKSAERAAKYLLNPNLKMGKSPYDAMRPYLPTLGSILETNVMKGEQ